MTDAPEHAAFLQPIEPSAAAAQAEIVEEFGFFSDWAERYQYLIDLGKRLPPMPEAWKNDDTRLYGGVSTQIWQRIDSHWRIVLEHAS